MTNEPTVERDLLDEALETWDYICTDEIVYSTQFIEPDDFEDAIACRDWLTDYKVGKLWFEIKFIPVAQINSYLHMKVAYLRDAIGNSKKFTLDLGGIDRDAPMFVDRREAIQNPKGMALEGVPSMVWLKRRNLRDRFGKNIFDGGTELLVWQTFPYWKRGFPLRTGNINPSECPGELIKSRSKAIDELPNEQRNFNGDGLGFNPHDVLGLVTIILASDGIRIRGERLQEFGVDFVKVMFCPDDLNFQIR